MERTLSPEQLAALSRLWDQAEGMADADREQWLRHLPPALVAPLRRMLADASEDAGHFLETLPKLADWSPEDPRAPLAEGTNVGPYRLQKKLGGGGMSEVWVAVRSDGMLKRQVALKLPHAWLVNSQFRERLVREREILASLEHRFIARLYDAGVTNDGQPYLALEQVEGLTITQHCIAKTLGVRQRLDLFLQILEAVAYAHAHRIVHRDLKPSNILVTHDGEVRLLDFGIAELLSEDGEDITLTQTGLGALTPSYASPEQMAGEPIGEGTDVYSLGVLLYELLTGQRPYRPRHPSRAAMQEAILNADIPRPSTVIDVEQAQRCKTAIRTLKGQVKGDLDTIVLTALKRYSAERYASVEAFAADIRRHLAGEAVLARPDGTLYRVGKLLRRNRVVAAAVAAVIASLTAGMAISLWQAHVAREQSRIAQQQNRVAESALEFMEDVFNSSSAFQRSPLKAQQTPARELLDNGVRRIDTSLQDAPQAKMRLLGTLSRLYLELDLHEQGLSLQRKRVELAATLYPPHDPRMLDAQLNFASMAMMGPAHEDASKMLAQVKTELDRQGDHDSRRRGWFEHVSGLDYAYRPTNYDPQRALMHAGTAVRLLHSDPPTPELVAALQQKGNVHARMGQFVTARDNLAEALRVANAPNMQRSTEAGLREPAVIHLLKQLCSIEVALANGAQAESHCRQVLVLSADRFGPNSLTTIINAGALGRTLVDTSRLETALSLLQPYLTASIAQMPADSTGDLSLFWFPLADALLGRGQPAEALKVLEFLDRPGYVIAFRPFITPPQLEHRADALVELGRYAEASALLSQALEGRRQTRRTEMSVFNRHLAVNARLALAQQQPDKAIDAAKSFRLPPGQSTPLSPDVLERDMLLAEAALAQQRMPDALEQAAALRKRILDGPHPALRHVWLQRAESVMGEVHLLAGNADAAQAHLLRALEMSRTLHHPQAPALAEAHARLGMARLAGGDRAAATKQLAAARAIETAIGTLPPHRAVPLRELQSRL